MELNILQSCRICSAADNSCINIFSDEGKKGFLQAKIRKYLRITVCFDDKLPKIICEICWKRLDGFHKFATMANRTQDKFSKILINNNIAEQKRMESKGLLHTYLTKGVKDNNNIHQLDSEVTELEVRVDPMVFLQCTLDDDDEDEDNSYESDSSEEEKMDTDPTTDENPISFPYIQRPAQQNEASKLKRILVMNYRNIMDQNRARANQTEYEKTDADNDETESSETSSELKYNCPICAKVISTKGNLKVHLETHRPKGKYTCDICGRIFKTQCNLYRHKEYHEGIQFPCGVCGRVYPTNSTLRAHSITHSNLRPHKCPLCDKTFKRNQDLKFHINQHTGARPYQCPYCPKAFASSGNCFSHRKRMHPVEVERDRERAASIIR